MNKTEKKLLRHIVYAVTHHNGNLWWELKRQIFDMGNQLHYPFEYEFEPVAQACIDRLRPAERQALIAEWKRARPSRAGLSDAQIMSAYVRMIIEEIVRRARSAAYRTSSW